MKTGRLRCAVVSAFALWAGSLFFGGCDTGEKVVDEVTGNRAVKQYHKAKEKLGEISDQQGKRYDQITEDEKTEEEK